MKVEKNDTTARYILVQKAEREVKIMIGKPNLMMKKSIF